MLWYSDNLDSVMDRSTAVLFFWVSMMVMMIVTCSSLNVTSDNFDEEFERVNFELNRI